MACGCVVFSSLNHALADTLTPGELGHQIGCGSLAYDVERIAAAVAAPADWRSSASVLDIFLEACSEPVLTQRWQVLLALLDQLLPSLQGNAVLQSRPLWRLRFSRVCRALLRVVNRLPGWPAGQKP